MISLATFALFTGVSILLALTPGPNMSLIIANTLSGGVRSGLATLAGTSLGLALLVCVAAAGMGSVMALMADWFDIVRWVGSVYLFILGCRQLYGWLRRRGTDTRAQPPASAAVFLHGLAVSLSNPKVLLFLGAFLPQFIDPTHPAAPQLMTLAFIFWATLGLVDLACTIMIGKARAGFDMRRLRILDGIAGGLLMIGGLVLATARRPV